jgi:hypothetical protein
MVIWIRRDWPRVLWTHSKTSQIKILEYDRARRRHNSKERKWSEMHLKQKIKEAAAAGYILLWLLGIPIPILLLIFLLRGCT